MKKLIGILLLFVSLGAFAQQREQPIVQFTGVVYNADSTKNIVPYVTITNLSQRNATVVANYNGYFSFVAHERDTLRFTSVGYAAIDVVIPAGVQNKSYTAKIMIKPQINNLPTVHLFPWATTDEFRRDFVSAKIADDDIEIARKNMQRSVLFASQNTLPRDGHEIQSSSFNSMHNNILNSHSFSNPLLNPLAWGSLIKTITDGDKGSK
jgi:hypothetical protein